MKRTLLILAVAVLVAGAASAASIVGSSHDLSGAGGLGSAQICVYCHTPHGASPAVPLWNHTLSSGTYTAYTSATMDNPTANWGGGDGTISALCMSCHDGTIALGSVVNDPGDITDTTTVMTGPALVGTDLTNDHPVNFVVTDGLDPEINTVAAMVAGGTPFFGAGAEMQCASCHNVHDPANAPFLVMANTGSALCLNCHIK